MYNTANEMLRCVRLHFLKSLVKIHVAHDCLACLDFPVNGMNYPAALLTDVQDLALTDASGIRGLSAKLGEKRGLIEHYIAGVTLFLGFKHRRGEILYILILIIKLLCHSKRSLGKSE